MQWRLILLVLVFEMSKDRSSNVLMYLAAEDEAREVERMREEYAVHGGHFQEYVQMHIDTFKELGSTKENPGLKYE